MSLCGEVEVERFRESEQREITREPLVMASEVAGLDPLHGFLKHGNLVVQMRFRTWSWRAMRRSSSSGPCRSPCQQLRSQCRLRMRL